MTVRPILIPLMLALPMAASAGQVRVNFPDSDHYTDAVIDSREPDATERELEKHLEGLGKRYLPDGQSIVIDVLDINLAGRHSMAARAADRPRILTNLTGPRIKLHYRWQDGDQVLGDAEETIMDASYLTHGNRYMSSDLYRYEKQMLDDWFRARFSPPQSNR